MGFSVARPLGPFEGFNLMLPFLFIGLGVFDFFFLTLSFQDSSPSLKMLGHILFLNAAHTALTFPLMFLLPEYKELIESKRGQGSELSTPKILSVFVASFLLFWTLYAGVLSDHFGLTAGSSLLLALLLYNIPQTHHSLAQIYGIGRVYGIGGNHGSVNLEKMVYGWFIFVVCCLVAVVFIDSSRGRNWIGFPLQLYLSLLSGALLVALFWINRKSERAKRVYLARLALWPLIAISPIISLLGIPAIHSIEYVLLSKKFLDRSNSAPPLKMKILFVSATVMAVFTCLVAFFFVYTYWSNVGSTIVQVSIHDNSLIFGFLAFTNAVSFAHFYADRYLFRMRRAENRAKIGPLLYS
jgi:hypothetical protein